MADYTEAELYARAMYDALRVDVGHDNIPPWEGLSDNARESYRRQANHVRAATHPAPITTREQLAALPSGSVVRTDDGLVYERQLGWTWRGQPAQVPLPARVLDVGYGVHHQHHVKEQQV